MSFDLIPYPKEHFMVVEDIITATSHADVSDLVTKNINSYHKIDTREMAREIRQAGKLLQLAFATSLRQSCHGSITEVLLDYHDLVVNTTLVSHRFVRATLTALQSHHLALKLLEDNCTQESIAELASCAKQANFMVLESNKLIEEIKLLCDKAKNAMSKVGEDKLSSEELKSKLNIEFAKLDAAKAELKKRDVELEESMVKEEKIELAALKEARAANWRALGMKFVDSLNLLAPLIGIFKGNPKNQIEENLNNKKNLEKSQKDLTIELAGKEEELRHANEDKKQQLSIDIVKIKTELDFVSKNLKDFEGGLHELELFFKSEAALAQHKAAMAEKRRAKYREEQISARCSLAETLAKLENMGNEKNDLLQTLNSLELAIKALGNVSKTFKHTKVFWLNIQDQCNSLTDVKLSENTNASRTVIKFVLQTSGFNWLSLAKVNYLANNLLDLAGREIDLIVSDLPTSQEAEKMIPELTKFLIDQNEADRKKFIEERERAVAFQS